MYSYNKHLVFKLGIYRLISIFNNLFRRNNMNNTLAMLHDIVLGFKRSISGKPSRSIKIIGQSKEWILCSFFEDKSHRVWLVNKKYELWAGTSGSNSVLEFNFWSSNENWFNASTMIDSEESIEKQLNETRMDTVFHENRLYFRIK